ncbi:hypothetical protein TSMEX_000891, partial [Taenia solium]
MRMKKGAMVDSISSLASLTGVAPHPLDDTIYAVPGTVDFDIASCSCSTFSWIMGCECSMRADFFELKNPIRVGRLELQKIRIHNLKSIYEVKLPEKKAIPMEESKSKEWKVTKRCFSIDWNIGLKQLTVDAESKLKVFFKSKVSECVAHSGQENLSTSDINNTGELFYTLK